MVGMDFKCFVIEVIQIIMWLCWHFITLTMSWPILLSFKLQNNATIMYILKLMYINKMCSKFLQRYVHIKYSYATCQNSMVKWFKCVWNQCHLLLSSFTSKHSPFITHMIATLAMEDNFINFKHYKIIKIIHFGNDFNNYSKSWV